VSKRNIKTATYHGENNQAAAKKRQQRMAKYLAAWRNGNASAWQQCGAISAAIIGSGGKIITGIAQAIRDKKRKAATVPVVTSISVSAANDVKKHGVA